MRLDKYLVAAFSLRSRTYAENLIKRGAVKVGDCVEKRPAFDVDECDPPEIEILSDEDFASLGAYKLQKAFDDFSLDVCGADCADIGCSNGGFTDLLLRKGARWTNAYWTAAKWNLCAQTPVIYLRFPKRISSAPT